MHRKRKLLLATVVLVILGFVYMQRNSNTNNNTTRRNNRRLEVLSVLRPTECKHEIVWLVHSSLTNFESRRVIRDSYSAQELDALGVVRIFVLGVDASYQQYYNGKGLGDGVEGLADINRSQRNNVKRDAGGNININIGSNIDTDGKINGISNINDNSSVKDKDRSKINTDIHSNTNINNTCNNSININTGHNSNTDTNSNTQIGRNIIPEMNTKSNNNISNNGNTTTKLKNYINTNIDINTNNNFNNSTNSNTNVSINPNLKKRHVLVTTILSTQLLIMQEQERYEDLLQADFLDTYRNLTLKHITGLNYTITHCPKILNIFKSDDDVIIDIPRILALINGSFSNSNGDTLGNNHVESNGKPIKKANTAVNSNYSDTERTINDNGDTNNNYNNNIHKISSGNTNTSTDTKTSTGTGVNRNSALRIQTILNANAVALSRSSISNALNSNSPISTSVRFHAELNIFGFKMTNKRVERNPGNKWFVTDEEYSGNYYPTFASGWLYFTSKPVVETLLQNYIEYTKRKEKFWIDDVFVTGMLRDGTGVEVVGLNEMYAVDYRYLQCCVKDLSHNLRCDYAVGPDGAKKALHKEFKGFLDYCRDRCRKRKKENSVKNTCIVAYDREEDIGDGKPVVQSV